MSSVPERLAGRPSTTSPRDHAAASQREIAALVVYFAAAILLTDIFNVRLGVEELPLLVALPALTSRHFSLFLHDWWFLLAGLVLWNLSGPIAAYSPFPQHLTPMRSFDRFLFFGHDPVSTVQEHLMNQGHVQPLDWATAAIYNLHLPEPYIVGYLLWRVNRAVYLQFAAGVLVLLVAGFVAFILFPAVPPWMAAEPLLLSHGQYSPAPGGRVYLPGVLNGFGPVLHNHPLPFHGTPIFYLLHLKGDAVAAFPSEHAAFPLLEALAWWRASRPVGRAWLLWVAAVLFTVVYLGEHWVTDVLAGWLFALLIWMFVRWATGASARGLHFDQNEAAAE